MYRGAIPGKRNRVAQNRIEKERGGRIRMEEKQLKYYKMHHDLQEQIRLGELRSGDRVPSENQLAAAYQVSRQTVRKALAILEQEGYIYAVHGKGTFVSERGKTFFEDMSRDTDPYFKPAVYVSMGMKYKF